MAIIDNKERGYIAGYCYGYFGSKVAVLTGDQLVTATLNNKISVVTLPKLANTTDPISLLRTNGRSFQSTLVKNLTHAEWHGDDSILAVMATDSQTGQSQNFSVEFDSNDQRQQFLRRLLDALPAAQLTAKPISIWRAGFTQLISIAVAMLVFWGMALATFIDGRPVSEGRGRMRGIAKLTNTIGPWGMLLVGAVIIVGLIIWWYADYRKPPQKQVVIFKR